MTRSDRFVAMFLLAAALLLVNGCTPDPLEPDPIGPTNSWQVFHPLPMGYDLNGIWASSARKIWAVGDHGVIVHWDGEIVRRVDSPTTLKLNTIDGRAHDDIYAAGREGVLHFDGHIWNVVHQFPGDVVEDILCQEDGTVYVVGTMGAHTRSAGVWARLDGPDQNCDSVWTGNDGRVRVAAGNQIWRHDNRGLTVEQEIPGLSIIEGDGRYAYGDGEDGYDVYRRDESGIWEPLLTGQSSIYSLADIGELVISDSGGVVLVGDDGQYSRIWANPGGRWVDDLTNGGEAGILACGYGGTLLAGERSADGVAWRAAAETIGYRHFNDLDGTGCDDIWAAEWWGRVLHFDGQDWRCEFTPLSGSHPVMRIQALADGHILAGCGILAGGGTDRFVLRGLDGEWLPLMIHTGVITVFWGITADDIIVGTNERQFLHWSSGSWHDAGTANSEVIDITGTADDGVYALTKRSPATLYAWNGTELEPVAEFPDVSGYCLHGSRSDGSVYIGGTQRLMPNRGVLYRYRDGETVELTAGVNLPIPIKIVTELSPELLFVLTGGELWRRQDGAWSREVGLPPGEIYDALWSHPDCGVFVDGHTTLFNPVGQE